MVCGQIICILPIFYGFVKSVKMKVGTMVMGLGCSNVMQKHSVLWELILWPQSHHREPAAI